MDWQAAAKLLATALGAIDEVVSKASGKDIDVQFAADALTVIAAILETVKPGDIESIDPEAVAKELELLLLAIGDNDDLADLAVSAKFDTTDTN